MNAIAKIETQSPMVPATSGEVRGFSSSLGIFSSEEKFAFMQRAARVFAESDLVPKHMQGKLSNCLIALNIAERLQEEPLTIMQNMMVVNGSPGWKSAYLISRANQSKVFHGRIKWRVENRETNMKVTAYATLAETGEEVSQWVDMALAKAEGWTKNPKYQSMPEIMLQYRSAAFLIRLHCGEVLFGKMSTLQTVEELETDGVMKDITPAPAAPASSSVLAPPAPPPRRAAKAPVEAKQPDPAHDPETGEIIEPAADDRGPETAEVPPSAASPEDDRTAIPSKAVADDASGDDTSDDFPGDRPMPKAAEPQQEQSAELKALLDTAQKKVARGKKGLNLWIGGLEENEKALIKPHYGELLRQAALNDVPSDSPAQQDQEAVDDEDGPGSEASVKRAREEGAKAKKIGMMPKHNPYLNREGLEKEQRNWREAYDAAKGSAS